MMTANNIKIEIFPDTLSSRLTFNVVEDGIQIDTVSTGGIARSLPDNPTKQDIEYIVEVALRQAETSILAKRKQQKAARIKADLINAISVNTVSKTPAPIGKPSVDNIVVAPGKSGNIIISADSEQIDVDEVLYTVSDGVVSISKPAGTYRVRKVNKFGDKSDDYIDVEVTEDKPVEEPPVEEEPPV